MADTFRPSYRIEANGNDITAAIRQRFISMTLTDEAGIASDCMTLELDDSGTGINLPATGAELRVWLGYEGAARFMGLYVVDEIELKGPPDRMTITAKAAPMKDSKAYTALHTQHNRSWTPRTLGDLAASIAAEHGLTPAVSPALASHTLPHLDQADESNMNLLTRVAKSVGGIAKANDGKLIIVPQGEGKTISGKSMPTVSIARTSGTSHSVKLIGRQDYKRVVTVWRDTNAAQDKEATAGEGEPVRRIRHVYPDQAAAEKAAQTSLEAYRRGKSTLSVSLPGRTELAAEGRLILSGFRSGVNGEWSITRVTHKLSAGGYVTDVEGEVPK
jgi:hypothetical protein